MVQIVKADMRHIQIFKQLSKLGRYPRRGDRGTVRLRYNKVIVIVRLPLLCDAGFPRGRCRLRCAAPVYRNFERYIASEIPRD